MKQIIFAGGVHGVGKSTLCRQVASALSIGYLSASEVLKWGDINTDIKNKKVVDIPGTQKRLLDGLKASVQPNKIYILDGHFCLFNNIGEIIPVPITTFEQINPISLILVTNAVSYIKGALEKRDEREYDAAQLSALQEKEISYAQEVADHLNIHLIRFQKQMSSQSQLIAQINESIA